MEVNRIVDQRYFMEWGMEELWFWIIKVDFIFRKCRKLYPGQMNFTFGYFLNG